MAARCHISAAAPPTRALGSAPIAQRCVNSTARLANGQPVCTKVECQRCFLTHGWDWGLCQSTGAEIETALCILESVLPTLVSPRYRHSEICGSLICCECDPRGVLGNSETRNLEFGGPLGSDPRGVLGNSETRNLESGDPLGLRPRRGPRSSETRKLGIWNLGVPLLCLGPKRQEGASETRKLGIWNLGAVPWARTQEGASETRKLGIWNMPRSILESAHSESWNLEFAEEYPGICP
jgi:hypothetical protein